MDDNDLKFHRENAKVMKTGMDMLHNAMFGNHTTPREEVAIELEDVLTRARYEVSYLSLGDIALILKRTIGEDIPFLIERLQEIKD